MTLQPLAFTFSLSPTIFMEMDSNSSLQSGEKQVFAIQCVLSQGLYGTDEMGPAIQR